MTLITGKLRKGLTRALQTTTLTALRNKLHRRIAYVKMEVKQGNVAAWILAQALGRLNKATSSHQTMNLCFCFSTLHVIQNLAASSLTQKDTCLFYGIFSRHLSGFIRKLEFQSLCASDTKVILVLFAQAWRGKRFAVWIPHLAPHYTPFVRRLLRELCAHECVYYIDDGFGFLSRDTYLFQMNYIPANAVIHSWDFTGPHPEAGFPAIVQRSRFSQALSIVQERCPNLLNQGLSKLRADKADAPLIPINFVLASKLLDVDFCLSKLNSQETLSRSFYIPHYDPAKNIEQVSSTLPSLKLDMPEFGLLGIAEHLPCRVFFGLTSSIIILLELLLCRNSSHSFELVFAGQESCQNPRHEELMRFKSLLSRYSGHVELRHHNISIVLAGETLI